MWTEEEIHHRWTKTKFQCRLMRTGLASFLRSNHEHHELARVGRVTPGEATLTLGRSSLALDRDEVELLQVPFHNISAVKVRPMSVDMQMFMTLIQGFRSGAWFGIAKTVLFIFAALSVVDLSNVRLPSLLHHLPSMLAWSGISIVSGLFLHLPFRFLPHAWRIEGRLWRMRFETMDRRSFSLLIDPGNRDRVVPYLRAAGLVVYLDPGRETWLDRGWSMLKAGEASCKHWASELFGGEEGTDCDPPILASRPRSPEVDRDPVHAHTTIELRAAPADESRGPRLVPLEVVQRFLNHQLFASLAHGRVSRRFLSDHDVTNSIGEITGLNPQIFAERYSPLDHVLQLSDVARPTVADEEGQGTFGELLSRQSGVFRNLLEKVCG
jgi:hypothetical protein